jgi:GT2 family glycosyltransferase
LDQKHGPEEILIYDDASKFPAKDYVPHDSRIKIIRGEENVGPSRGRNRLLREATTDFIHFHDSDDFFFENWAATIHGVIDSGEVDAVFSEVDTYIDGKLHAEKVVGFENLKNFADPITFAIHHGVLVPTGTYRRELVLKIEGYREDIWQSEDYEFHVRLIAQGFKMKFLDAPLVGTNIREESRSQNKSEVWKGRLQAIDVLSHELPTQYYGELSEAAFEVGSVLYKIGEKEGYQEAFQLAFQLGTPKYKRKPKFYRLIAGIFGPAQAEKIGYYYRKILPQFLRIKLSKVRH